MKLNRDGSKKISMFSEILRCNKAIKYLPAQHYDDIVLCFGAKGVKCTGQSKYLFL